MKKTAGQRESELLSDCTNHIERNRMLQDSKDDLQALYEAKCAEAEELRNKARVACFAYGDATPKPEELLEAMKELYLAATFAEAGKPLLEELNKLRQEIRQLKGNP